MIGSVLRACALIAYQRIGADVKAGQRGGLALHVEHELLGRLAAGIAGLVKCQGDSQSLSITA